MKTFGNGIKDKLSVIILSYAIDNDIFEMNCRALKSLTESETWTDENLQVLLIESKKDSTYTYPFPNVKVLIPKEDFGFHKFFNIGISKTNGEYIAFCNNDIIFKPGWFSEIKKIANAHKRFKCFSPIDDSGDYPKMAPEALPRDKDYYKGWEHQKHFAPWCFVWKREVFDITGPFDETFDLYGADADELHTLSHNALWSVVCTKSVVRHLAGQTTVIRQSAANSKYRITDTSGYPLTEYESSKGYQWLYEDYRFYEAYQKVKKKWGIENTNVWLQRKITKYKILNIRVLTRLLFTRTFSIFLSRLRGIKA